MSDLKQDILTYVKTTPANTNLGVLNSKLNELANSSIYDDPNNLVGFWSICIDEGALGTEVGAQLMLITPEEKVFQLGFIGDKIYLIDGGTAEFNPNGQFEYNGAVMGSWELLNGTLSTIPNEGEVMQYEKCNIADMLCEWIPDHASPLPIA